MTREEAITVLKGLCDNPLFSDVHKAAFNIAIHDIKQRHDWDINNLILINKDNYEPLEQEPTTKNDLAVDLISRADVLKLMKDNWHTHNGDWAMQESMDDIRALPSVTPQEPIAWIVGKNNAQIAVKNMPIDKLQKICAIIGDEQEPKTGHCRDCKWWKDSDGAFRRGIGAESQCPMNRIEVFEGNGYCYMFEPQESEDKE